MNTTPTIIKAGLLAMQVCVPGDWSDEQVEKLANSNNPAGTELGWKIRKQGDKLLDGADERVVCSRDPQYVHIMLDC
jgi:hypothetical protein